MILATPSDPNAAIPGEPITFLKPETDDSIKSGKAIPEALVQPKHGAKRNFKFTKRIFESHGYTQGCVGCEALQSDAGRRSHFKYCRDRIAEELEKSQEGRKFFEDARSRLVDNKIGQEDDDNMLLPDNIDEDNSEPDDDDSASEESGDGNKGLVAWIQGITQHGCIAEEVHSILIRVEKEVNLDNDTSALSREGTIAPAHSQTGEEAWAKIWLLS